MGSSHSSRFKAKNSSQTGVGSKYVRLVGNNDPSISSLMVSLLPASPGSEGEILQSPNLQSFSYSDMKTATRNFSQDSRLGEGKFGSMFKGWIDEQTFKASKPGTGVAIAVKRFYNGTYRSHTGWLAKVYYLAQLYHPTIARLVGSCWNDDHCFLVFEFMPMGSLENHLFTRGSNFQPLSWYLRLKIALGVAKGLVFLHEMDLTYGNFDASNVLLDLNYNAKLSVFNLLFNPAKDELSWNVNLGRGAAPEYAQTGRSTTKSDVYSLGLFLLELLSGRKNFDINLPSEECVLVDKSTIHRVLDDRLNEQHKSDVVFQVLSLAYKCLSVVPKCRPTMVEVLRELEELQVQ